MNTQQARNAYPEFVVGGVDSQWNVTGTLKCDWSSARTASFLAGPPGYPVGGVVRLRFHPSVVDAYRALSAVMAQHGYTFNETAGGSVSCRKITGGDKTSPHAHGYAFDINPSKNRYRISAGPIQWGKQTDMSPAMIADIKNIKTVDGLAVFVWGGDWTNIKDPMHFEPTKVTRPQLERGIDFTEGDMSFSKGLTEAQWRELYRLGVAGAASEDQLIDYWVTNANARTDAEHDSASASMFTTLARQPGGAHNHDGVYLKGVEGVK